MRTDVLFGTTRARVRTKTGVRFARQVPTVTLVYLNNRNWRDNLRPSQLSCLQRYGNQHSPKVAFGKTQDRGGTPASLRTIVVRRLDFIACSNRCSAPTFLLSSVPLRNTLSWLRDPALSYRNVEFQCASSVVFKSGRDRLVSVARFSDR